MRAMLCGEPGDLRGFPVTGVVFPEPALRGKVFAPLRIKRQRHVGGIDRQRTRAGGVDPDADDPIPGKSGFGCRLCERGANRFFQTEKIIGGILAGEMMIVFIEQHALIAARVVKYRCAKFLAGGAIDDQGASRIGAIIHPQRREHGNSTNARFLIVKTPVRPAYLAGRHDNNRIEFPTRNKSDKPIAAAQRMGEANPSAAIGTATIL